MISKDSWIELPVGYNLADHLNVRTPPPPPPPPPEAPRPKKPLAD